MKLKNFHVIFGNAESNTMYGIFYAQVDFAPEQFIYREIDFENIVENKFYSIKRFYDYLKISGIFSTVV